MNGDGEVRVSPEARGALMDSDYCYSCDVKGALRNATAAVCKSMGIRRSMLWGRDRGGRLPIARQVVWHAVRSNTGASYPELGKLTGYDHTTVLYGIRRVGQMLEEGNKFVTRLIEDVNGQEHRKT